MSAAGGKQETNQLARARRYATGLLDRRACSRSKLMERLARRGFDEATAAAVVEDLARIGLLNDEALAESLVRTELARKPAGAILLETKLAAKGIDRATARRAARVALEDRDLSEDATELARRRARVLPEGLDATGRRRRLYAALARRGFDPDTCRLAIERVLGV